jgi:hypothetical protein
MASECDNSSIVIEDSIRQNFFGFMDKVAYQIFDQVFNQWASKILEAGVTSLKLSASG